MHAAQLLARDPRAHLIAVVAVACLALSACGADETAPNAETRASPVETQPSEEPEIPTRSPSDLKALVGPVASTAQKACTELGPRINRALKRTDISLYDPEPVITARSEFVRLIRQLDARISKAAQRSGLAAIEPPEYETDPLFAPQRAVSRLSKFARLIHRQAPLRAKASRGGTSEAGIAAADRAQTLHEQAGHQDWTTMMGTIAPACDPDKVLIFGYDYGY